MVNHPTPVVCDWHELNGVWPPLLASVNRRIGTAATLLHHRVRAQHAGGRRSVGYEAGLPPTAAVMVTRGAQQKEVSGKIRANPQKEQQLRKNNGAGEGRRRCRHPTPPDGGQKKGGWRQAVTSPGDGADSSASE